ncbi:MAG: DMT family transporter [Desulfobacterales bacterium]|jgi:drug/metabolite transporter (DMT)-like permease
MTQYPNNTGPWYRTALPYLLTAVAPLCWGGNIVLARGVVDIIPPVSFAFWRWTIAFLILLPFAYPAARQDWALVVKSWKIMSVLSIFGISIFNTLLYTAVHTTTAINGAMIQTTMPAVIILATLIMFKEKVTRLQILGVGICIFGAFIVILRGRWDTLLGMSFASGDVLMMGAVILYALYSALLRRRPAIHPLSFLIYTFGLGIIFLLPIYIWELARSATLTLTIQVVLSILYVALFPSILAYFCWNRGVELLGANRTGLFINLIPVFASILAIVFLGETLQAFHIIGMTLICSGMILFNR